MLLPPSGPRSNCTALGLRFSEENWLNTPWAVKRTGGLTDTRTMSTSNRSMTVGVVRPSGRGLRTARPLPLVESLNGRPRDVSGEVQVIGADVHHGPERPRQYSAQLRAVPFHAPTEPRREVAVGVPAAARVGDRPQVGAALRRVERLLDRRRAAAAGGMKVG